MKKIIFSAFVMLLLAAPSFAANLGCFEASQTVYVWAQFYGPDGSAASPTSPTAKVYSPTDTTAASFTPTIAEIDSSGAPGLVRGSFTLGASPALGVWMVQYKGTVSSLVRSGTDNFEVRPAGKCGTVPPANFSSLAISPSGIVNAQVKGMDPNTLTAAAAGLPIGTVVTAAAGCNNAINSVVSFSTNLSQTATNHWRGTSLITMTSGALTGQSAQILGYTYTGSAGCLTVVAPGFTAAPAVGDTFAIINK